MSNPLLAEVIAAIAVRIPELAIDLIRVFSKESVTDADWEALRAKYSGKSYDGYIAAARQTKN